MATTVRRNLRPLILLPLLAVVATAGAAQAQDRTQALVGDLRRAIAEAERHGQSREDLIIVLQGLVARYDEPFAHVVLRDSFQDGDFRRDPTWRVLSGGWQAVAGAVVSPPVSPEPPPPATMPDEAQLLQEKLTAVTRMVERMRQDGQPPTPPPVAQATPPTAAEAARLAVPVAVPPVFRLTLAFTLREGDDRQHAIAVSLGEGQGARPAAYRLAVERQAGRSRVVLERTGGLGAGSLGAATLPAALADGALHRLTLERGADGALRVLVDDRPVLEARDGRRPPALQQLVLERQAGRLAVSQVEVRAGAAVTP
ncbi:hypothetical protein [Caenispirillum bisanense]|uniref:hypothetical protein n=1 Tax=Caenispirillum bisanense TaxID=414052 RepID=UPI0031E26979